MSRPGGDASDEALAAAANAGDRGALEVLLARHLDRVHAICRRVTGHPEDALDATQEALIAVTRGLHRYDGRSLFTTWLYRVATNAALDELRRKKRRPEPAELSDDPAFANFLRLRATAILTDEHFSVRDGFMRYYVLHNIRTRRSSLPLRGFSRQAGTPSLR